MLCSLENPPDLIVVIPADNEQEQTKKHSNDGLFFENDSTKNNVLLSLQLENSLLRSEIYELKSKLQRRQSDEYQEQANLLQHRFHEEIQKTMDNYTKLIKTTSELVSDYVTDIIQKSISDIESLRLLHQKEICVLSKEVAYCLQQQSIEMKELLQHIIQERHTKSISLLQPLINDSRISLEELNQSFNTKMEYLVDIHSSIIDKLNSKHDLEMSEMKCELSLMSEYR